MATGASGQECRGGITRVLDDRSISRADCLLQTLQERGSDIRFDFNNERLNEPTAASLAYGFADGSRRTVMVYDLGGGTFDVSVVLVEGDVTEVLASHGNNRLGGDDFDDLLLEQLQAEFQQRHGVRIGAEHPLALARLWWAAEIAKKQLSFQPYAQIREEALITKNGKPESVSPASSTRAIVG